MVLGSRLETAQSMLGMCVPVFQGWLKLGVDHGAGNFLHMQSLSLGVSFMEEIYKQT